MDELVASADAKRLRADRLEAEPAAVLAEHIGDRAARAATCMMVFSAKLSSSEVGSIQ